MYLVELDLDSCVVIKCFYVTLFFLFSEEAWILSANARSCLLVFAEDQNLARGHWQEQEQRKAQGPQAGKVINKKQQTSAEGLYSLFEASPLAKKIKFEILCPNRFFTSRIIPGRKFRRPATEASIF